MSSRSKFRPSVALVIEPSSGYGRGLYRGIFDYLREQGSWILCLGEYRSGQIIPDALRRHECDGVIARIDTPRIASPIKNAGVPVVDVSSYRLLPSAPCIETDD